MTNRMDLLLGIIMLILGILAVVGRITFLGTLAGLVLVVVGVLMLIRRLPGGLVFGIAAIVLGTLLLVPNDVTSQLQPILDVLDIVIGVLLIVFGVLKIMGK